jgi:hypothetical protein
VYTEKVNKVSGYVKGKLGNLWKQLNKPTRNLSKKDSTAQDPFYNGKPKKELKM